MNKKNTKLKSFFYNGWLYLLVLLFFIPFFGNFGQSIFAPLGKYYYAILFIFCYINLICRYLFCYSTINEFFSRKQNNNFLFRVVAFIISYCLIFCVFLNDAVEDFLYAIVIIGFLLFFSSYKYSFRNLSTLSSLACIINIIFFMFSQISKFTYFNPNTYAEITTILFLFSCIGYRNNVKWKMIRLLNLIITIYTAEIIYRSETQLLVLLFFLALYMLRKFIFKTSTRCKFTILLVWLFVLFLPFISYILVKLGIASQGIFTDRGERWVISIDALINNGIFSSNLDVPGSHNGFLDICVKYTFIGAVIFIVIMIRTYFRYCPYILKDITKIVILCTILSIVLMNSVESVFVGLTDGYFLMMLTGILISLCINEKQKKGRRQINRGKIYCEKCYI